MRREWQIRTEVTVEVGRGGAMGQVGGVSSRRMTVSHRKSTDKSESPTPRKDRAQVIDRFRRYSKCPELPPPHCD